MPGTAAIRGIAVLAAILLAMAWPARSAAAGEAPDGSGDSPVYYWDAQSRHVLFLKAWKDKAGDDVAWAAPGWPDGDWTQSKPGTSTWLRDGLPAKGIRWYRARVRISGAIDSLNPFYLHAFHNPNAQEIYWDGMLVGVNGRVGTDKDSEIGGLMFQSVSIPWKLSGPGEHLLAIRISNFRTFTGGLGYIKMGLLKPLQDSLHGEFAFLIFLVGIFFIASIYHFANFMTRIQPTYALFSLFCMGCTMQILPIFAALYLHVKISDFLWAEAIKTLAWSVMMTSLPMFFLSEFAKVSRHWFLAVGLTVAAITLPLELAILDRLPEGFFRIVNMANEILGFAAIVFSLGITAWAVWKKKEGSGAASLGLLCLLSGVALGEIFMLNWGWAVGLTVLILLLNGSLARQLTRQGMAFQENNLRGARLEIELLKKNIQPHFLLNSLRSITDWLEREPKVAARLVNSLAAELRMMLKLSSERIIPLAEEIKLCRSHLEVMGLRGHRALSLETSGVDGEERIPPMVLHTLLEMGLEEAGEGSEPIRFLLAARPGSGLRLRLSHDAPLRALWQRPPEETGIRYVRARLQEAFPDAWNLRLGPASAESGWHAEVDIEAAVQPP